jgi:ketosteroid isomerase-like protein
MADSQHKQRVMEFLAATKAGDRDRLRELVTEDLAWWVPKSGSDRMKLPVPMIGAENFVSMQQDALDTLYQRESQQVTVSRMVEEDDVVAAFMRMEMLTQAGVPYSNEYVLVFRFDGGRIAEHWEYTDTAWAFEQFDAASDA